MSPISPEKIARLLKRWNDNPDMTMRDCAKSTGIPYGTAQEHIRQAIARGEARPLTSFSAQPKTQAERNWAWLAQGKRGAR
jgi:hypothetical protein